jgi:hypothetical protein
LQEIRPASLSLRARPLLHDKARLRSSPPRPVISAKEREQSEKTGKSISPPAPPPRDPKCYAMSVDRMGANSATGDDCSENGSVRGPGLRLSLIGNEAIQSWLGDAIPGSEKKQGTLHDNCRNLTRCTQCFSCSRVWLDLNASLCNVAADACCLIQGRKEAQSCQICRVPQPSVPRVPGQRQSTCSNGRGRTERRRLTSACAFWPRKPWKTWLPLMAMK